MRFTRNTLRVLSLMLWQVFSAGSLQAASFSSGPGLEVGPYVSTITYEEPGIMKESGTMSGVRAALVWRGDRYGGVFDTIRLEGSAGWGPLDYTSDGSGSMDGIDNSLYEARALFGRNFSRYSETTVQSFVGFGYRYLSDRSGGMVSSEGFLGYDRRSQYLYMPVGFGMTSRMDGGWLLEGVVEYDLFLRGFQKSYLTQVSGNGVTYLNDVTSDQYDGDGLKVALRFSRQIGGAGRLAIEPFLNYWNIGKSRYAYFTRVDSSGPASYRSWEPANHSTEVGLRMLFLF